MTVYENLYFYAKIKGIAMDRIDKIIDALIEEMSLSEFPNKIAGRLSGGNKRKLSVAISMICNPPIILLDEPSTGMDPEARRFMWAVIHKISTKRKKSSVIMTTHSMDEAETLCKRMGIMVNGEFVCLGGSNEIKEKYGYGFEADIRIKPLSDEMANQILKEKSIDPKLIVKPNNLNDTLIKLGKEQFLVELQKGRLGEKLLREVSTNERFRVPQLLAWTYFTENALKLIKKSKQYFEEIILTEYIDNNFLFKLKKGENSKSIGFLFGLFESIKDECYVTEYSIQPTSLEQIFNKFAAKQGHDEEGIEVGQEKTEILIDDELLGRLVK
jgi:ATP-binding cassette subfamily A (ABC1) protein 3